MCACTCLIVHRKSRKSHSHWLHNCNYEITIYTYCVPLFSAKALQLLRQLHVHYITLYMSLYCFQTFLPISLVVHQTDSQVTDNAKRTTISYYFIRTSFQKKLFIFKFVFSSRFLMVYFDFRN